MASRFLRKCPACETLIHPDQVPLWEGKGFPCPNCGEYLRSSLHNLARIWAMSLLASAVAFYALGFRSWTFLVSALFGAFPISFVVYAVASFIFPSPLERASKKGAPD